MRKVHMIFGWFLEQFLSSSIEQLKIINQNINLLNNYSSYGIIPDNVFRKDIIDNISSDLYKTKQTDILMNKAVVANFAKEEIAKLESQKDSCEKVISFCSDIKNAIKVDGFHAFIDDIECIYRMIHIANSELKFSDEEQVALLGMIIRSNATQYTSNEEIFNWINKHEPYSVPFASICVNLSEYFNEDGSIVAFSDKNELRDLFEKFFDECPGNNAELQRDFKNSNIPTYEEFIFKILSVLDQANDKVYKSKEQHLIMEEEKRLQEQKSIESQKETEMRISACQKNYKAQCKNDLVKKNAIKKISEYYLDGEFIAIPQSTSEFVDLLKFAGYNGKKIESILNKMTLYIEESKQEKTYLKYMSLEDYNTYLNARKKSQKVELSSILSDIDAAIILEEELDEKDEELQNEINELVLQMKTIMKSFNLKFK